ncbi:MAG: rod shape-determining protein MreD [Pelagibacterales bacterium]|nr:rod shape-determining protein MreD [Pelagibacterales bacterium]
MNVINLLEKKSFIKYLPFFLIVLSISISSTIFPPRGYAMTIPFIPIICIIFWSLLIGKNLNIFQYFLIGIYTDLLLGTPLGSYLLIFSILRYLSIKVKARFQIDNFFKNIIAAFILIIIFFILSNLFFMIYYGKLIFSKYLILNILATIFLYPALAVVFLWIYKITSIEKYYVEA